MTNEWKKGKAHDIFTGFLVPTPEEGVEDWVGNGMPGRRVTGRCQDVNGDIITTVRSFQECLHFKDSNGKAGQWMSYPDSKYSQVISQSVENVVGQVNPDHWPAMSMATMDGLFVPFATDFYGYCVDPADGMKLDQYKFKKECLLGSPIQGKWIGADHQQGVTTFEVPEPGVDFGMAGSGVVTSVTLNPFASGHYLSAWSRNLKPPEQGLTSNQAGYSEAAPTLTRIHGGIGLGDRPIGFRGPMVVSGWGYDTDDKPVPNAYFDADQADANGKPINLPGHCVDPTTNDILTTGFTTQEACEDAGKHWDGVPTRKKPADNFFFNHLKRPDKWKTGPVDLRWDRERKVWVAASAGGIYLAKATRCILPKSGADGKNSFNFGILDSTTSPGRMYRNPCPNEDCEYGSYFPESKSYPDIEIYDPEDIEWCGNCEIKKDNISGAYYVSCQNFTTACVPFYDAVILRKFSHIVKPTNQRVNCGDKLNKVQRGDPQGRRMGNPCHQFGLTITGPVGEDHPLNTNPNFGKAAKSILYERILIENPLNQGLMMGDAFISSDTGRKVLIEYTRKKKGTGTNRCGGEGATVETVSESIPIHIILQAEFFGQEVITMMGCEQGETTACSKKVFIQGFTTLEDCGPQDDYPTTAITY